MLWKNLILCINRYAREHPDDKGSRELWRQAREQGTIPLNLLIDKMDVRNVGVLRDLMPQAFPKKLRKGPLLVDQNHFGHWRVLPHPDFSPQAVTARKKS